MTDHIERFFTKHRDPKSTREEFERPMEDSEVLQGVAVERAIACHFMHYAHVPIEDLIGQVSRGTEISRARVLRKFLRMLRANQLDLHLYRDFVVVGWVVPRQRKVFDGTPEKFTHGDDESKARCDFNKHEWGAGDDGGNCKVCDERAVCCMDCGKIGDIRDYLTEPRVICRACVVRLLSTGEN